MSAASWRDLVRCGWARLSAPGDKCGARWRHEESGWEAKHCGHPTANWPWLVVGPSGQTYTAPNGKGFRTLPEAAAGAARLSREAGASPPAARQWVAVAVMSLEVPKVTHLSLPTDAGWAAGASTKDAR